MKREESEAFAIVSQYQNLARRVDEVRQRMQRASGQRLEIIALTHTRELGRLQQQQDMILTAVNGMAREQDKRLLELRYVDGCTWGECCQRLYISRSTMHRRHTEALREFLKSWNKMKH